MIANINDPKLNDNTRKTVEVPGHELKIGDKFMDKGVAFCIVNISYDTDSKTLNHKNCATAINRYIVTGEWIKIRENEVPPSYCYPANNSIIRALSEDLNWTMLVDECCNQSFSTPPTYGVDLHIGNDLLYNM